MAETQGMDIDYVARLARLELSDDERTRYAAQLERVLEHFDQLSKVDVEGIEPTAHASARFNVWREDAAQGTLSPDDALRNAPTARDQQFVVPKVVEDA